MKNNQLTSQPANPSFVRSIYPSLFWKPTMWMSSEVVVVVILFHYIGLGGAAAFRTDEE
jgi:hypothetical protein